MLYKRPENGRFQWPKNNEEMAHLTPEQFQRLVSGLSVFSTIVNIGGRVLFFLICKVVYFNH